MFIGSTDHPVTRFSRDILTVGKRRFEILLTDDERPYLRGEVAYFEDDGPDSPSDAAAELVIERFREAIRKLRHAEEMPIHISRPYRHLSFRLAAALPLDLDFKQQLLTLHNEPERITLVQNALEILLHQIEHVQESPKKAGGNGHLRQG